MTETPRVENRFSSRRVGRRPVTNFDEGFMLDERKIGPEFLRAAYFKATSARFEHGEAP
jgi:hypothetical protein